MGYLPLINWCTISIVVISPSSPAIAPGLISFGRTVSKPPKADDLHESRAAYFGMFHGFHVGENDQVQMFYRFLSNQKSDGQHQLLLLSSSVATTLYLAPCLSSFIRHGKILAWYLVQDFRTIYGSQPASIMCTCSLGKTLFGDHPSGFGQRFFLRQNQTRATTEAAYCAGK